MYGLHTHPGKEAQKSCAIKVMKPNIEFLCPPSLTSGSCEISLFFAFINTPMLPARAFGVCGSVV